MIIEIVKREYGSGKNVKNYQYRREVEHIVPTNERKRVNLARVNLCIFRDRTISDKANRGRHGLLSIFCQAFVIFSNTLGVGARRLNTLTN